MQPRRSRWRGMRLLQPEPSGDWATTTGSHSSKCARSVPSSWMRAASPPVSAFSTSPRAAVTSPFARRRSGADVVALDITPENLEAGRKEAEARGVALEWVEGDAQALPFGDGEFDVVTSSFGAIFAPDHQKVAGELLRVCRPGGTIGMTSFPPVGMAADIFGVIAPYMHAPPSGALSPLLWGTRGARQETLQRRRRVAPYERTGLYRESREPPGVRGLYKETFGPVISVYEALQDEPHRVATLDREFLDFAERANRGTPGDWAEYPYEYILVVARKRSDG